MSSHSASFARSSAESSSLVRAPPPVPGMGWTTRCRLVATEAAQSVESMFARVFRVCAKEIHVNTH